MNERCNYLSWDEYFAGLAMLTAARSKDPSSQVGCIIVDDNNHILSLGYNGAPNGFSDSSFPWQREGEPLETKYLYVVHSEMNAILNFPGDRSKLSGVKMYVTLFLCNECAKAIIQSGVKEVIYLNDKYAKTNGVIASKLMFKKCGVSFREYHLSALAKKNIVDLYDQGEDRKLVR